MVMSGGPRYPNQPPTGEIRVHITRAHPAIIQALQGNTRVVRNWERLRGWCEGCIEHSNDATERGFLEWFLRKMKELEDTP